MSARTDFIRQNLSCMSAALMLCVAPAAHAEWSGTPLQNLAYEFVTVQKVGNNLAPFALQATMRTLTYASLVKQVGASKAQFVVEQEINKLLPDYQEEWNGNLAKAYAMHFSPDELSSLATDGLQSPYSDQVAKRGDDIGIDMQQLSQPLLKEFVARVVADVNAKYQL